MPPLGRGDPGPSQPKPKASARLAFAALCVYGCIGRVCYTGRQGDKKHDPGGVS